jgi:hypothetical protein
MSMTSSQPHVGNDTGYDTGFEVRGTGRTDRHTYTETKLGTKTTEFYVMIVAIAGILIGAFRSGDDSFSVAEGFQYATFVAVAYIISRGLAKLGTREPYTEDRN